MCQVYDIPRRLARGYTILCPSLTLYRPYLYSYPIGITLLETRLTSPLGQ